MLLAVALLAGCSEEPGEFGGPQDPEGSLGPVVDSERRLDNGPEHLSVDRDDLAQRDDPELSTRVSLREALKKATAGDSAAEGEEFALAAILHLAEQSSSVGPKEIATLVAADQEDVAQYVDSQMGITEQLGGEPARIDPDEQPYLRSEEVEPGLVRTSLALYVLYPGVFEESDGTWIIFTTESRHRDGAWQLTHWNNGAGSTARDMTPRELEVYFDGGEGWRRPRF